MPTKKLWKKDFSFVVIGQIISLFGNAILRFALPLYLLDVSGSSTLYGTVLAGAIIPNILFCPIGGILADRVNKRNIMVILDFSTAVLIVVFSVCLGKADIVLLIIMTMIILYAIQGIYQPTVQSSIPLLADQENMLAANAIINQVNSLASIIGPVIGGMLFGQWGLTPILIISGVCFFMSAVLEIFIHIPYTKQPKSGHMFRIIKNDLKESLRYMAIENPNLFKGLAIVSAYNLFITSMIMIGVPVLISQVLKLDGRKLGFVQGVMMAGGIAGGFLVGGIGKRIKLEQSHLLLMGACFVLLPIGISLLAGASTTFLYYIIMLCCFLCMIISTIFSIKMLTFIQMSTPGNLLGKVMSCVLTLSMCTQPIGLSTYGVLFEKFEANTYFIIFGTVLIGIIIALFAKKVFTPESFSKIQSEIGH